MTMTMLFETMESITTMCGGMPTTMRTPGYRDHAQIGNRAAPELTDSATATGSNIYSYVNGNPMSFTLHRLFNDNPE
jgi:hypothetical protein